MANLAFLKFGIVKLLETYTLFEVITLSRVSTYDLQFIKFKMLSNLPKSF